MAFLYVTEYAGTIADHGRGGSAGQAPKIAQQVIAIAGASAPSAAFNTNTRLIRVHTDAICAIEIGASPTAVVAGTTGTARMAANQTEYFGVSGNLGHKIAVIAST